MRDPHAHAPKDLREKTLGHIDDVVPGTKEHFNGNGVVRLVGRRPVDARLVRRVPAGTGHEVLALRGDPAGRVHFAGEHTSSYSQGYLNGGVESGDRTAIEVMKRLGVQVPHSLSKLPYSTFV